MSNRDIIVFSDDWGRHPSSCQHLIKQLLPTNRVMWVNTIGMRSPRLTPYDLKRCSEIIAKWLLPDQGKERSSQHRNLVVTRPVIIPYNRVPTIRAINKLSVKRALRSMMRKHSIKNPLVITTFPCTCDYVGAFGEDLHIYYCVDDFVNWPGIDLDLINSMENQLIERSDLVLATADALCQAKERRGKRPLCLPHGVDFEHFHAARAAAPPRELLSIRKPIVGFFGAISEWLDLKLLAKLAKDRPHWSIVLIGPVDTDVSALSGIKNIHLLGKVPYPELPRYGALFDVGIIPFKINELTSSVNPLKLFEYLALGIPVVSTYMPEVAKHRDVVAIPADREDFTRCVEEAMTKSSPELRRLRVESARKRSWRSVAETFSALVAEAERGKQRLALSRQGASR